MRIKWSRWIPWDDLHRARRVPIHDCPGVYEARRRDTGDSRLHTGKATHLRARIKSGLVRGTLPHSARERIRRAEDISRVEVHFGTTATGKDARAAEQELHRRFRARHGGKLPKHTKRS